MGKGIAFRADAAFARHCQVKQFGGILAARRHR